MQLGARHLVRALLFVAGCARSSTPVEAPSSPVSTTRTSAAELASDAPHVGKPQQHAETEPKGEDRPKDEPRREGERKPRGGFSGYK